jgi:signal transduction histidine kinase
MYANPTHILLWVGITLGVLIGFFVISILRHHRRYLRLQQERTLNEIILLEKERKRIAYDLHDELGPVLSSIKLNLMTLQVPLPEDQELVEKSCRRIDDIVNNMQSISYDLLPVSLQKQGLLAAIRELAAQKSVGKKLKLLLELDETLRMDPEKEIHVFRIVQELLYNTLRHAQAENCRIVLQQHQRKAVLIVEDDGKGFSPQVHRPQMGGLGLKSIESRAQALGARSFMRTAPGKGFYYFFEFDNEIENRK